MKKFLAMGALALAVAAIPQHQAKAWHNSSFSFGMNWSHSCGGNNLLWGLYRNGQPGEGDLPNCPNHNHGQNYGYGYPQAYGHGFEGYEGQFQAPQFQAPMPSPVPSPASAPVPPAPQGHAYWYGQPAYQAVNYAPSFSGGYYMPVNWYGR